MEGNMRKLRCSFCKKNESEVAKLVAGRRVYICNECVDVARRIMEDDSQVVATTEVRAGFWRSLIERISQPFKSSSGRSANLSPALNVFPR
jgi:hypothetical protein